MPAHTTVQQIIDGIEPQMIRDKIKIKYPWVLSAGKVKGPDGITSVIQQECMLEQLTLDRMNEGYGAMNDRHGINSRDSNIGGGGSISNSDNNISDGNAQRYTKLDCYNCAGKHRIADCTELCKRCDPPCGKIPHDCPVFMKHKGSIYSKEGKERGEYMTRVYTSNNATTKTDGHAPRWQYTSSI